MLAFFEGCFDRGEAFDGEAQRKIRRDGMIGVSEQFSQHRIVEVESFFGELCELEQILKPKGFGQQEFAEADGFLRGAVGGALIVVDEQSRSEELGVKVSPIKAEATVAGALDDDVELFGLEASSFVEDAPGALIVGGDRKRPRGGEKVAAEFDKARCCVGCEDRVKAFVQFAVGDGLVLGRDEQAQFFGGIGH